MLTYNKSNFNGERFAHNMNLIQTPLHCTSICQAHIMTSPRRETKTQSLGKITSSSDFIVKLQKNSDRSCMAGTQLNPGLCS